MAKNFFGIPKKMKSKVKSAIKEWLPPKILDMARRVKDSQGVVFKGNYASWQSAVQDSAGYDAQEILSKVRDSTLKVKTGEAAYERDSVLFSEIQYSWPVLAGLLKVSAMNQGVLRVLDFGGALGSSYFQNRGFLKGIKKLGWFVVEQESFVQCGRDYFESENLKFYYTIEECLSNETVDVVLLSSVLPYLEKPWEILTQILELKISTIIIDLNFVIEGNIDRLTIQTVPPNIYSASYPAYFLSEKKLLKLFQDRGYELIAKFDYHFPVQGVDSVYKGFIHEQN